MKELPEITARVKSLVEHYENGVTSAFAEQIGVSQQRFNRLFNIDARTNKYPTVPSEVLVGITNKFVDVDSRWLLSGKGDTFLPKDTAIKHDASSSKEIESLAQTVKVLAEMLHDQREQRKTYMQELETLKKNQEHMAAVLNHLVIAVNELQKKEDTRLAG